METDQPPILDHATYEGDRFTYGFRNRPPGYAHCPKGYIMGSDRPHADYRYGTIDYPRRLTPKEIYDYELAEVQLKIVSFSSWREYRDHMQYRWATEKHTTSRPNVYVLFDEEIDRDANLWHIEQSDRNVWVLKPYRQV